MHGLKKLLQSSFFKNPEGTKNLTTNKAYRRSMVRKKHYVVNYKKYTPNKFINYCWYQTELFLMGHIAHAVSEQSRAFYY